jgi:hypothetical protein
MMDEKEAAVDAAVEAAVEAAVDAMTADLINTRIVVRKCDM